MSFGSSQQKCSDLLIMGSGAAGYTAAIYSARAGIDFYLLSGFQLGGQLTITTDIENYPGFAHAVSGPWLMEQMRMQAENAGAKIIQDEVTSFHTDGNLFKSVTALGGEYVSKAVIIATGAQAMWLGLESEQYFMGAGVSACAVCDGAFFKNKVVAVIGGGNVAVEEALFLAKHVKKVFLIHRRDKLKAEAVMQSRLFSNTKIEVIWNSVVNEITGNHDPKYVTGLNLRSTVDGSVKKLDVDGVFVAIGHSPNTSLFRHCIECDENGYIITSGKSTKTSLNGVFAAGDVCDKVYRQAVVAAGSGCMASIDVEHYLSGGK